MGTGQERGQESPDEEGSKEVIWLVPSLWERLYFPLLRDGCCRAD